MTDRPPRPSIDAAGNAEPDPLHDRLREAIGDRTNRHVSELTGTHPETVRRYLNGQSPSVEFLGRLCGALRLNGEWLLTGRGPMRADEVRTEALRTADASDLLTALANTVDRLIRRVERLEVFAQSLDAKLRARTRVDRALYTQASTQTTNGEATDGRSARTGTTGGQDTDPRAAAAVARVARAAAKRPSPPAG